MLYISCQYLDSYYSLSTHCTDHKYPNTSLLQFLKNERGFVRTSHRLGVHPSNFRSSCSIFTKLFITLSHRISRLCSISSFPTINHSNMDNTRTCNVGAVLALVPLRVRSLHTNEWCYILEKCATVLKTLLSCRM